MAGYSQPARSLRCLPLDKTSSLGEEDRNKQNLQMTPEVVPVIAANAKEAQARYIAKNKVSRAPCFQDVKFPK